jgi:plastocyanin
LTSASPTDDPENMSPDYAGGSRLAPQSLNAPKGTAVYWMNLDSEIGFCDPGFHDVDISAINVESPVLSTHETWDHPLDDAGDFYYIRSIHPFMTAQVDVSS